MPDDFHEQIKFIDEPRKRHILPCTIFVGFKPTGDYHADP